MKTMIIGSGGREHALTAKIANSDLVEEVLVLPGNPGMTLFDASRKVKTEPCDLKSDDGFSDLIEKAKNFNPDLIIIGPDDPLAEGITDRLEENGFKVFGPTQNAAKLESSKSYAKEILKAIGVATPGAFEVSDFEESISFLISEFEKQTAKNPEIDGVVIKANGLALGKGVSVCANLSEAETALREIFLEKKFGTQSALIEKRIEGVELSAFALCNGADFEYLGTATDYKRRFEGNKGPNTGGMGAISPFPAAATGIDEEDLRKNIIEVFDKTLKHMVSINNPFKGFMFLGLMIENGSEPLSQRINVIEYNVRMGDPETQCLFPRIDSDLFQMIADLLDGKSERESIKLRSESSATICAVSDGYPSSYEKGFEIQGLADHYEKKDCRLYFAGVSDKYVENAIASSGGRVFAVSTLAENYEIALEKAYEKLTKVRFQGMKYRNDIGSPWFNTDVEANS